MSLVIAKKSENDIYLISDTKLSESNDEKLVTKLEDNILKIVIINSQLVFAFAGAVSDAEVTLERISNISDINSIRNILLESHIKSYRDNDYSVEFILAIGNPDFNLVEFKNGKQLDVKNSWLGSQKAFNLYQSYFLGKDKQNQSKRETPKSKSTKTPEINIVMDLSVTHSPSNQDKTNHSYSDSYSKSLSAMKRIIESGIVSEVGGFYLPVAYYENKFQYMLYSTIFSANQTIPITKPRMSFVIPFGSAEQGAYNVTLNPIKDKIGNEHVTFHFNIGKLGLVYKRSNSGLPRPSVFPEHDAIDFSFELQKKFQLEEPPGFSLGCGLDDYGINADKYIKLGLNDIALERLNWGILKNKKNVNLWKLYRSRAFLYFNMQNFPLAILDFNKVLSYESISNHEQLYKLRGDSYSHTGKYLNAIGDYTKCLALNSNNSSVYFNRSANHFNFAIKSNSKRNLQLAINDLQMAGNLGYDMYQIIILKNKIKIHLNNLQ